MSIIGQSLSSVQFTASFVSADYIVTSCQFSARVGEENTNQKACSRYPGDMATNPVTAITFSFAAIHFPIVYNIQHQQRPVPLIPCLYGVGRSREMVKVYALAFSFSSHTSYHRHDITEIL